MNVLLPTLGSSGDVNPFVAPGVALQARGHRATVITNPIFQAQIESQGLRFLGVGTAEAARSIIANPDLWHARKSVGLLAQMLLPSLEEMFRVIEAHAAARESEKLDLTRGNKKRRGSLRPTPPGYRTDGGVGWLAGARFS